MKDSRRIRGRMPRPMAASAASTCGAARAGRALGERVLRVGENKIRIEAHGRIGEIKILAD
jgi:hypothetical protein